jgi:hypothetical protein
LVSDIPAEDGKTANLFLQCIVSEAKKVATLRILVFIVILISTKLPILAFIHYQSIASERNLFYIKHKVFVQFRKKLLKDNGFDKNIKINPLLCRKRIFQRCGVRITGILILIL